MLKHGVSRTDLLILILRTVWTQCLLRDTHSQSVSQSVNQTDRQTDALELGIVFPKVGTYKGA